jgi:AraC family transcriptional regulator of arabinose operon
MATQQNFLHLWDDRFLYITPAIHSGLTALSLNLDPASSAYRMLARHMGGHGIQPIDARRFGRLRDDFEPAQRGLLSDRRLQVLSAQMVESITEHPEIEAALDKRIERVLEAIRANAGQIQLRELSVVACLSPDRLTHLFAEQVGVSVKRYALWTKVRRTVQQFTGHRPLTDVALVSGFTDAAHMSRTFQRYFGLPPSFLANQVRVTADEQASHAWGRTGAIV